MLPSAISVCPEQNRFLDVPLQARFWVGELDRRVDVDWHAIDREADRVMALVEGRGLNQTAFVVAGLAEQHDRPRRPCRRAVAWREPRILSAAVRTSLTGVACCRAAGGNRYPMPPWP
jgi:hypothetical protein